MRARRLGFKERCKMVARKVAFTGMLMASTLMPLKPAQAEEAPQPDAPVAEESSRWLALRPGYLPRTNQLTTRIEGGASFSSGTSLYGLADFQPTDENSASMDSYYSEISLTQDLYRGIGIFAELDSGTGMVSIFRPGLSYSANPDGWLIQLTLSPYSFGGQEDVRLSGYVSKTFGDRIFTEALLRGYILTRTLFAETAMDVLFLERFSAGLQVRILSDLNQGTTDVTPVLRASVIF